MKEEICIHTELNNLDRGLPEENEARQLVQEFLKKCQVSGQKYSNERKKDNNGRECWSEKETFYRELRYQMGAVALLFQNQFSEESKKFSKIYQKTMYSTVSNSAPKWMKELVSPKHLGFVDARQAIDHRCRMGKYLITNPYHLQKEDLRNLIEITDQLGVTFLVRGDSYYFPSFSIMIRFSKSEEPLDEATSII